ncbi:MAG: hypothetical protein R3E39_28760 [Anaerolineae bacterium]
MAEMAQLAKLPLHGQAGSSPMAAELTQLASGNRGAWRCTVARAAVGSLMAAAAPARSTECLVPSTEEGHNRLNGSQGDLAQMGKP